MKNKTSSSWRDEYPVHPCADVYPMMLPPELLKLAEDIKQHGLMQAPILWEDPKDKDKLWLLDGRNRLEALAILERQGHPWDGSPMIDYHIKDPATYIISANIRRRHLTKAQQAELIVKTIAAGKNDIAKLARSFNLTNGKKGGSTKDPIVERAVTEGKKHGISARTIHRARAKVNGAAPKKKIGLSKQRPKNEALPLGVKRGAAQPSSVPQWQRVVQAAISQARQLASAAEIQTYVRRLLEQESIAS